MTIKDPTSQTTDELNRDYRAYLARRRGEGMAAKIKLKQTFAVPELSAREQQMLRAVWEAWMELNTIRARDGVPYQYDGTKSSVDEGYFSSVVDACAAAIEAATGRPPEPWMPKEVVCERR